jgi:hypothetical protein
MSTCCLAPSRAPYNSWILLLDPSHELFGSSLDLIHVVISALATLFADASLELRPLTLSACLRSDKPPVRLVPPRSGARRVPGCRTPPGLVLFGLVRPFTPAPDPDSRPLWPCPVEADQRMSSPAGVGSARHTATAGAQL